MLSGISLSGAITEIFAAGAMVAAAFAALWAVKRIMNLFRKETDYTIWGDSNNEEYTSEWEERQIWGDR